MSEFGVILGIAILAFCGGWFLGYEYREWKLRKPTPPASEKE